MGRGGVLSLQTRPRAWGTRGHRRPHVPPTRDPRRPPTRGPPRPPHPHPRPADSVPLSPTPTRGSPRPTALPGAAGRHAAAAIHPHRPPRRRTDGEVPTAQRRRPQTTPPTPPPALGHPLPSTPPPTHPPVSSSPLTLRPRWHRTHGDGTVETHGRDGTRRAAVSNRVSPGSGAQHRRAERPPPPDGPPTLPAGPPPPPAGPPPPLTHLRRPREPRERRRGAAPRRGARPSPSRLQDPSRSPGAAAPELRPPQPPLSVRIAPPPPPPVAVRPDPAREEELPAPPPTAPPADTAPPVTPNGRGGGGSDAPPRLRGSARRRWRCPEGSGAARRCGDPPRREGEMRLQRAALRDPPPLISPCTEDPHLHHPMH